MIICVKKSEDNMCLKAIPRNVIKE